VKPTFFATPADFRAWLERHHEQADELLVGFYKKDSGRPSITWPESVDEALSFGWIDGVRRRIDDVSYSIRFTPRRRGSIWSAVNIGRVEELTKLGRMSPAGLAAFAAREESKSRVYAFENAPRELPPADEKKFRANRKAWKFFSEQPPGYRRLAIFWVTSAKREETRARRLGQLIEDSGKGVRLKQYTLGSRSSRA
jgi:uncharacterized protein YdeI (YjbR/CyaY-like superfamily)